MDPLLYIKIVVGVGATLIALLILISSFRHKGILASFLKGILASFLSRSWKLPKEWKTILLIVFFCFVGQWLCRIKVVVQRDSQTFVNVEEWHEITRIDRGDQTFWGVEVRRRFSGDEAGIAKKDSLLTLTWPLFGMWSVATPDVEPLPSPPPPLFVSVGFFGSQKAFKSDLLLLQPFPTSWKRFLLGVFSYILAIYLYFKRIHPLAVDQQDTHSSCWFDLPISPEENKRNPHV